LLTNGPILNCCPDDFSNLECQDLLFEGICQENVSANYCVVCIHSVNNQIALINHDPVEATAYFTQCDLGIIAP
jgi:hypothetical protein